jgi:hypothetical protein
LAVIAFALSANAQTPATPKTVSPETIASAKNNAAALIAAAQVSDLFEDITDSDHTVVRHRASGFQCDFNGTPGERLVVFPSSLPRGDDVGCSLQYRGVTVSLDVARYQPTPALDDITTAFWKSILRAHPDAKSFTFQGGHAEAVPRPNFPKMRTVLFSFDEDGQQRFSRLCVAILNGWVVEERATSSIDNAGFADVYGQAEMIISVTPMIDAPTSKPQ